jgi:hypothetical protein
MSRLAYVPRVYRDELFYSLAARYHRHVMNVAYTATNMELFGTRSIRATFDLPSHLPAFVERVPPERGLTVHRLASENTLLPYYSAFLPRARREESWQHMMNGNPSMHLRIGVNTWTVPPVSALRFCSECCVEMMAEEGELWWMRAHQLPGVVVCPHHGCVLRTSGIDFWARGQHGFAAATAVTCSEEAPAVIQDLPERDLDRLRDVAIASAALLHSPGEVENYSDLTDFYRERLWKVGLCRSRNHVDMRAVIDGFGAFYGGVLDVLPGVLDPNAGFDYWLAELCRRQRKSTHPLLHVLLRVFLAERPERVSPFGRGPWRCPNPEAGHGDEPSILTVRELNLGRGRIQGTFECPCGYAYTMSVDSEGVFHGPRFSRFGPLLDPAVTRLVAEGSTLRGAADYLGIHPRAVAAAAARLGLPVRWKAPDPMGERIGRGARKPPAPRRRTPKPTKLRRPPSPRLDWVGKDRAMAAKIGPAADAVLAKRPLVRVSLRAIETQIDRPSCIYMRRQKLPRTMAALAGRLESSDEFQRRRIEWAIQETRENVRKVTVSGIMRLAGVKEHWKGYVEERIALPILPV